MKLLIDMNLSPQWVGFFKSNGIDAVHWSTVGAHDAADATLMAHALADDRIVFTHDLDYSAILAHAGLRGPSVVQVRTQAVMPEQIGTDVVSVLARHREAIERGAIVVIDEIGARVRILPISRHPRGNQPA